MHCYIEKKKKNKERVTTTIVDIEYIILYYIYFIFDENGALI